MSTPPSVKITLKRGALVAAANWQVTAIQFVADSTVKLLLTVPLVGGGLVIALVLGKDIPSLTLSDLRTSLLGIAAVLMSEPLALVTFLLSFGIVGLAGSVLLFLTKGGTVSVLAMGERDGGPVEEPPLLLTTLATAARFTVDRFHDGCTAYFRRYLRLGLALMAVYGVSGAIYLSVLFGNLPASLTPDSNVAWTVTAGIASSVLAVWITLVNFAYLLIQMVIVADGCGVGQGARRAARFLRAEARPVLSVFGLVLLLVVCATGISLVATTSLGLIAFVPLVGLAVVPLQLLAWLFRGLIFQYLELSAMGAYLNLYRRHQQSAGSPAPPPDEWPSEDYLVPPS
jgi:hypothetical protein